MKSLLKPILLAVAGIFIGSLLSPSSASASDGFMIPGFNGIPLTFSDNIRDKLPTLSQNNGCGTADASSSVNCNLESEDRGTILPNETPKTMNNWGHDGKGIIFADSNTYLKDKSGQTDPQARTAHSGDLIGYSVKVEATNWYNGGEETLPFYRYQVKVGLEEGMTVDPSTIVASVGGDRLNTSEYEYEISDSSGGYYTGFYSDNVQVLTITIPWATYTRTAQMYGPNTIDGFIYSLDEFIYEDNSTIEVTFSAKVDKDTGSLSAKAAFRGGLITNKVTMELGSDNIESLSIDSENGTIPTATAWLDGGLLIKRIGVDGQPVEGAKYVINDVKASLSDRGEYEYDPLGDITEFVTNEKGEAIIKNVPIGTYSVTEVSSPDGSVAQTHTIAHNLEKDLLPTQYGERNYSFNLFNEKGTDVTDCIEKFSDGTKALNYLCVYRIAAGYDMGDGMAYYDEEKQSYASLLGDVVKEGEEYIIGGADGAHMEYSPELGRYRFAMSLSDTLGEMSSGSDSGLSTKLNVEKNADGTASFSMFGIIFNDLPFDEKTNCYSGTTEQNGSSHEFSFCEDGDGYLVRSGNESSYLLAKKVNDNEYDLNYDVLYYDIEEIDDSTIKIGMYLPMLWSKYLDTYLVSPAGSDIELVAMDFSYREIMATSYLFVGIPLNDETTPEEIPSNPQTTDPILLPLITLTALGLTILASKQLALKGRK